MQSIYVTGLFSIFYKLFKHLKLQDMNMHILMFFVKVQGSLLIFTHFTYFTSDFGLLLGVKIMVYFWFIFEKFTPKKSKVK